MSMMRIDRAMSQAGKSTNSNALNTSTNSTSSLVSASSSPPKRTKSGSARASNFNSSSTSANGRRAVTASVKSSRDDSSSSGRVRVAARLRPRSAEEKIADADFPDCVELQPEFKRLRLRKNNWESETFQFDEVFTETASQKRVYEVVAKPVVESVLKGYNGTVMAYGQTGTGKTFTLGQLGEKDSAQRGIMIRALEDILADVNPEYDSVTVSYLQLYLESLQDLLAPEKDNIPIVEDPKSGDVSLPGATMVQVHDHKSFVQLLKTGEVNRYAANTKMNTESSRSHAILLVYVKRSVTEKKENENPAAVENGYSSQPSKAIRLPTVRNSKLLLVDLAGSERVNKAGSEGHTLEEAKAINLSLTALGKCINALAENSSHIPIRDSKLTRLLRDSFGGSARTSLVITIGPSPRHRGETASTIMFGQRAMKVENMVKLKEEFDYKSLCRKLENQLDMLTMENERQSKIANDTKQEMEKKLREVQLCQTEADKKLALGTEALMKEKSKMQEEIAELLKQLEQEHEHKARISKLNDDLKAISEEKEKELHAEYRRHQRELDSVSLSHQHEVDSLDRKLQAEYLKTESLSRELHLTKQELKIKNEKEMEAKTKKQEEQVVDLRQTYQKEVSEITQKLNMEYAQSQHVQEQMKLLEKKMNDHHRKNEAKDQYESLEIRKKLDDQAQYQKRLERELYELQVEKEETTQLKAKMQEELQNAKNKLQEEQRQRGLLEEEIRTLKQRVSQLSSENKKNLEKENSGKFSVGSECQTNLIRSSQMKDTINGQRATIAKLFEEVGLPKILSLLESEDVDVRIHAVKVVANLAAEEVNQEKIVEAGGLTSLLLLLETSEDETIQRVAAGAIANLAMNEKNQELIMRQGGIKLLARIANKAEDPQTLRMVAGAIANLCGNDKLQLKLRDEGGIKALLGMVRSRHQDVLAQVARGVANFAKCESRGAIQGHRKGRSLLIDDGALPWIVTNSNSEVTPIRRHIELALCHLAQHEANARDLVACGALWELVRISRECSREDIRNLARRTLSTSSTFQMELKRMHSPYD